MTSIRLTLVALLLAFGPSTVPAQELAPLQHSCAPSKADEAPVEETIEDPIEDPYGDIVAESVEETFGEPAEDAFAEPAEDAFVAATEDAFVAAADDQFEQSSEERAEEPSPLSGKIWVTVKNASSFRKTLSAYDDVCKRQLFPSKQFAGWEKRRLEICTDAEGYGGITVSRAFGVGKKRFACIESDAELRFQ